MSEDIDYRTQGEKSPGTATTIRSIQIGDLDNIRIIMNQWVRNANGDPILEEIDYYIDQMKKAIEAGSNNYLVSTDQNGRVTGMMGYRTPEEGMIPYTDSEKPAELINAYVSAEATGRGIGKQLEARLESVLLGSDYTEIILNSGPRYEQSGWGFYDSLEGFERTAVAKDYYGEGWDAVVWRKELGK